MECLIIPATDGGKRTWKTDDWVIEETCHDVRERTDHEGGLSDNSPSQHAQWEVLYRDEPCVCVVCACMCVRVCASFCMYVRGRVRFVERERCCLCRYNIINQPAIVLNFCFATFLRHFLLNILTVMTVVYCFTSYDKCTYCKSL